MKKIIAFVFMFCLMLLSSCASKGGEAFNETYIDGVAYEYYEDVFSNNEIYTLYKPAVINHPDDGLPEYLQAVQYSYQYSGNLLIPQEKHNTSLDNLFDYESGKEAYEKLKAENKPT